MKGILFIGHGTRSKKGAEEARLFIERVKERIDAPIQELSFLELTEPSIEEGFRACAEKGATEITVVPLFLLAAGHIKSDIPQALAPLMNENPSIKVTISDPFGLQDLMLDAAAELVRSSAPDLSDQDSVLIVGRGSSDPDTLTDFSKIAEGIRSRLPVTEVSVCYMAAASPRLDKGLEEISKVTRGQVILVPYLLFSGLLLNEVKQKVRIRQKQGQNIIHTGQLSRHREIENIVIQRAANK